jgi:hypothetical protein
MAKVTQSVPQSWFGQSHYITVIERDGKKKCYIQLTDESIAASATRKLLNQSQRLTLKGKNREGLQRGNVILNSHMIRSGDSVSVVPNPKKSADDKHTDMKFGIDDSSDNNASEHEPEAFPWTTKLRELNQLRDEEIATINEKYDAKAQSAWNDVYSKRCLFQSCGAVWNPSADDQALWSTCGDCFSAKPPQQFRLCSAHSHKMHWDNHQAQHAKKRPLSEDAQGNKSTKKQKKE